MANQYQEMKQRQQEEFNAFPCFFAFSDAQFNEGMKKIGLKPTDTKKVCAGLGGMIYRKTDSPKLVAMLERFGKEQDEAIAADITGDGFIYDMFEYELSNHEYTHTRSVSAAITACGFTAEQVMEDPRLKHGLEKACIDLTGQTFDKLFVMYKDEPTESGKAKWVCQCECGNFVSVLSDSLRNGRTKSCGCNVRQLKHNLTGQKFGFLRVIEPIENPYIKGNETRWKCRCGNCGRIVQVSSYWLRHSDPYGHCKCTRFNKPQSK